MRIATSQSFDRPMALMQRLSAQADAVQTQIATGKKLVAPSGDAGGYLRLQNMRRAASDDAAWGANITMAQGILAQADATLESVESQLVRAQELATQAATGTLSDANRAAIGKELESIREALFNLGNTQDVRGQPLFGGAGGDTAYVREADGTIAFAGTGEPPPIPVGEGVTVQTSVTGERAFASGESDIFAVLSTLSAALAAGGDVKAAAGDGLAGIKATIDQTGLARASVGARAARLDLDAERLVASGEAREAARSEIEDVDVASAITELQKTLTILQATQASFTRLSGLTLFDYLR